VPRAQVVYIETHIDTQGELATATEVERERTTANMAKDRNTFAKHQRAMEKKHKADKKRERRAKKSQKTEEPDGSPAMLSPAERSVLDVFRTSQISAEATLSLGSADHEAFEMPLAELVAKGLLVAETSQGVYSLTKTGFSAMQDGD